VAIFDYAGDAVVFAPEFCFVVGAFAPAAGFAAGVFAPETDFALGVFAPAVGFAAGVFALVADFAAGVFDPATGFVEFLLVVPVEGLFVFIFF